MRNSTEKTIKIIASATNTEKFEFKKKFERLKIWKLIWISNINNVVWL